MSTDTQDHDAESSLDLFSELPVLPAEAVNNFERYARVAAEIVRCRAAWIDIPGQITASHPAKFTRSSPQMPVGDLLQTLFPGGIPRELTILPDIASLSDGPGAAYGIRFVVAAPIVNAAGHVAGVIALADTKPHKPTATQIDAFRDILALVGREASRLPVSNANGASNHELAPIAMPAARLADDFFDTCETPAWLLEPGTERIVDATVSAAARIGYSRAELCFLSAGDISQPGEVEPDAPDGSSSAQTRLLRTRDGLLIDTEILSLDVVYRDTPARLELIRDVSQWRRMEDRSRFQSSVLAQINEAVIAVDLNFRITHWNHVAENMYDWRSTEVLGERLPDILQPIWKDVREERDASTALLAQGRWIGEAVHHRRSGEMLFIESSVTAIKNSENRHIGFLCLNRDVTERKKMESSLQEGEQRYRSLFDFHPDAVVWIDLDGKLLSANLACMTILGYMPDELVGKSFLTGVDPRFRVMVLDMFERATHGEPVSYEYTGLRRSGRKVSLSAVALPVIVNGEIVGVYAISQDIGERKRLQDLIAGENEVLQWLAAGKPIQVVVERLILNIEERYDWLKCTALIIGDDRTPEVVAVSGSLREARARVYEDGLIPTYSTVAQAIQNRKRAICADLSVDETVADQRDLVEKAGLKGACSTPIIGSAGEVLGTFTFYLKETRQPTGEELKTADRAVTLLRIAIETHRAHLRLSLTERAMDSTVASVVIIDPNKHERPIIYVNAAFERITGYRREDVVGRSTSILYGPETAPSQIAEIEQAIHENRECNILLKYYCADGRPYWCSSSISPVRDAAGRLTHFIEVQNDVTPLMDALDKVRESEQRFRQLIENASDMVLVLEESGVVRYVSPAITRILGYQADEVRGRDLFEFIHPDQLASSRSVFLKLLETSEELLIFELRIQKKDGGTCLLETTCQNLLGMPGVRGVVVNARDLTERKQASERLDHLAYHDVLTDLPNRLLFNDHLTKTLTHAKRRSSAVAVLFLDLDRFKVINDTLGHSVGDELLQHVAKRLVGTVREGDTVARWGGDEFTLILSGISTSREAARIAQKIITRLSEPFHVSGHELYITATVGISMFPNGGDDVETLVRNADTAMYRAKEEGQNHYQFYTPKMNAGAGERLALEGRLRRALEREEFVLHYQPQVEAASGRIIGAECLVRWQHPGLGLVSPKDFIPLAEETGLIVPIGDWIMKQACRQVKSWHDAGYDNLRVAVNLSARQFSQRDLNQMVTRVLKETEADPTWLELELTESLLINCESRVISAMKELAAMGVSLAIDDFGVGYATYSYLKRYPVNAIKIEQSFVRGMLVDAHDNAIIQSILAMAHKLGLHVVAEGVETKAQADVLIAGHCQILQGYYFGRPVPEAEFMKMLDRQRAGVEV